MPNDSTSSKTNDQKPTADTIPPIFVDQGDLPPMINSSAPSIPLTTVGSAAPTDDIVSTVMPAITTSGTPKKKFAGGKIIATILGLFLLVGGVGAGVYLTGQNQDVREKASGPPREDCGNPGTNTYECGIPVGSKCCTIGGGGAEEIPSGNCANNTGDCFVTSHIGVGPDGNICDGPHYTTCASGYECKDQDCVPSGGDEPPGDETPPPATTTPTTPPAIIPVCQSTTISKTSLAPGESLTITSTATTSDITGFSYGFYNKDNLYPSPPDNNAKPIWFVPNTHYVKGATISPTNSNTITVTYDELNRLDLNWGSGQQKPTKISVNAFFGNSAGWNHSDANCIEQFNIAVAEVATLSCNSNCDFYNGPADQCGQGRLCLNVGTGAPQAKCRNPQCSSSTNCICTSTGSLSCTSLTSNIASPVVGQSITGTCRGSVPSSATSPVARFAVTLNGTVLGASESIPLNSAGTASYTATVPQQGNYLVQCQICTDSTLSNCTTMGQAN